MLAACKGLKKIGADPREDSSMTRKETERGRERSKKKEKGTLKVSPLATLGREFRAEWANPVRGVLENIVYGKVKGGKARRGERKEELFKKDR